MRSLRLLLRTSVGLALFLAFCSFLFPYDRMRPTLVRELSQAVGAPVEIERVSAGFHGFWPSLRVERVVVGEMPEPILRASHVWLRPEPSRSWLRGEPSLAVFGEADPGALEGVIRLGDEPTFRGRVEGLPIAEGTLARAMPAAPELLRHATGTLTADFDVRRSAELPELGWTGSTRFELRDGRLPVPEYPVWIPFSELSGLLSMGVRGGATLEDLSLVGPGLEVTGRGELAPGIAPLRSPMTGELALRVQEASLASVMQSLGVEVDDAGHALVRFSGSLSRPVWR